MSIYRVRYVNGPNYALVVSGWEEVEADSLAAALALRTDWPVAKNIDGTSAWAKHPGTSLYQVEAWEAELVR